MTPEQLAVLEDALKQADCSAEDVAEVRRALDSVNRDLVYLVLLQAYDETSVLGVYRHRAEAEAVASKTVPESGRLLQVWCENVRTQVSVCVLEIRPGYEPIGAMEIVGVDKGEGPDRAVEARIVGHHVEQMIVDDPLGRATLVVPPATPDRR